MRKTNDPETQQAVIKKYTNRCLSTATSNMSSHPVPIVYTHVSNVSSNSGIVLSWFIYYVTMLRRISVVP